jgi:hypothetical protein
MSTHTTPEVASAQTAADSAPVGRNGYVRTEDAERHTVETVNGHDHQVNITGKDEFSMNGSFDDRVRSAARDEIAKADTLREQAENVRANHRNVNRELMLVMTLVIGFALVYTLPMMGSTGRMLQPFSFCITVFMDLGLTTYALIRKY